ncbi:uncharacterized protein [Cherax quadricarinatus]|uniref:uncharacterized protein n=1 Tax=Cherax quadricarinatus TaxID=27406 RepID=UPI00387EA156
MSRGVMMLVMMCVMAVAFTLVSANEYRQHSSEYHQPSNEYYQPSKEYRQPTTTVQQTPGILERLMTDYVYPLRDYDWRGMLRSFVDRVMHYIAPATKEPKHGLGANQHIQPQDDHASSVVDTKLPANLEGDTQDRMSTLPWSQEESFRFFGSSFTLNSNVNASLACYTWVYSGILVLFGLISFLSVIIPLIKYQTYEQMKTPQSAGIKYESNMSEETSSDDMAYTMAHIMELTTGERKPGYYSMYSSDKDDNVFHDQ